MQNALKLQSILTNSGFKTLAAGGFVRDSLLGNIPKDIDLATVALPQEVIGILTDNAIACVPTGLKHGTVTAILDKTPYEITTLRIDKVCRGREAEVEFVTSFEEDAKRRDFTVNALFMDLETKEIFDYVGGQIDLGHKVLRFVDSPEKRIKEDYLRILRLYRFTARLGFIPGGADLMYCERYLPYLCYISLERIKDELCKMLVAEGVHTLFAFQTKMIFSILPELKPTYNFKQNCQFHSMDVYHHTIIGLNYLKQFNDPILSIAHLFHDVAKPFCHFRQDSVDHFYGHEIEGASVIERAMSRLKFSSKDITRAKFLVRNHMRLHSNLTKKALRRLLHDCEQAGDRNLLKDLYNVYQADLSGMIPQEIYPSSNIDEILTATPDAFKSPLSGNEIMAHLNIEGILVGKIKYFLKEKVVEGSLLSEDKATSLQLASDYLNNLPIIY